ncbi:MAG TPA: AraC family transcriptional regulator [Bacteroidetes bacterium]|nr:AraC family transcriptional regulator [Bacteroidota bacterium]
METQEIYELTIKNMICSRCMKVVRQDLEALGIELLQLKMGKIKFRFNNKKTTIEDIKKVLEMDEFEFVKDKDEMISEEIKLALIELVKNLPLDRAKNLSDFLVEKLHRDYWTLSKTFSKTEGVTIQRYFILLRIEKAKELIEYEQMNFSEIAYELGYQNIYGLSAQFKQEAGISMSEYKKLKNHLRTPFDKII